MAELPIGNRLMDRAYLRDGRLVHTGESLLLACLVASKGKTNRSKSEMADVSKIMKDPNRSRKK